MVADSRCTAEPTGGGAPCQASPPRRPCGCPAPSARRRPLGYVTNSTTHFPRSHELGSGRREPKDAWGRDVPLWCPTLHPSSLSLKAMPPRRRLVQPYGVRFYLVGSWEGAAKFQDKADRLDAHGQGGTARDEHEFHSSVSPVKQTLPQRGCLRSQPPQRDGPTISSGGSQGSRAGGGHHRGAIGRGGGVGRPSRSRAAPAADRRGSRPPPSGRR
jgi:hypothetical protein